MEEKPKISIIVPAYNVEKYIAQCLQSLVNQTYKNLEIIVVNDGSKDKTGEIIQEFAKKDNRIIYINQENKGVAEARNVALQKVDSEFVMFVDSDDWLDLETCETVLNEAIIERADMVMFGYVREYAEKSLPKAIFDEEKAIFEGEEAKDKLHRRIFGPIGEELRTPEKLNANTTIWGKLYKTSLVKNVKFVSLQELGLCEDGYFNISIFKNVKKAVFIKKYFYHYRKIINGGSLTQNKDKNVYEDARKFYAKLKQLIEAENLSNDYKSATMNRFALCLIERVNDSNICYSNLINILNDEEYKKAISNLDFKYFPLHWKLFFECAKIRFTLGVYSLLKMINLILMTR